MDLLHVIFFALSFWSVVVRHACSAVSCQDKDPVNCPGRIKYCTVYVNVKEQCPLTCKQCQLSVPSSTSSSPSSSSSSSSSMLSIGSSYSLSATQSTTISKPSSTASMTNATTASALMSIGILWSYFLSRW